MMHGPEKSDPSIVAAKSTNKAGLPAAEPRERAKGNTHQQRTRRAQDRESVLQVLTRVRKAARSRKTQRFTSLLDHLEPAMLLTAFFALRRDTAVGVDGMTWRACEADLDRRIDNLHRRVQREPTIDAGDAVFERDLKYLIERACAIVRRRADLKNATLKTYEADLERRLDRIMALDPTHPAGTKLKRMILKFRS